MYQKKVKKNKRKKSDKSDTLKQKTCWVNIKNFCQSFPPK